MSELAKLRAIVEAKISGLEMSAVEARKARDPCDHPSDWRRHDDRMHTFQDQAKILRWVLALKELP